jgi:hypothetical protein
MSSLSAIWNVFSNKTPKIRRFCWRNKETNNKILCRIWFFSYRTSLLGFCDFVFLLMMFRVASFLSCDRLSWVRPVHTYHAVLLPCRVASHMPCRAPVVLCRGLEKRLGKRHGRSTVGARHYICESDVVRPCRFPSHFSRPRHSTTGARHGMCEATRHGRSTAW